ncbi:sugar lactone lactonase YvrE [Bradyrhizobium sp. LB1.3]
MISTSTPRATYISPIPWGTGPGPDAADRTGAVYQYSKDGILRRIITTGSFPNGIAVSPDDGTLAVADYASNRMLYYSFLRGPNPACADCANDPSHTTFFFATAGSYNPGNGGPDGIHYDVHGNLWAACGIGGVIEYDPRGFIIGYVPLPNGDSSATNFAFGGENNQYIYMEGAVSGTVYKFNTGALPRTDWARWRAVGGATMTSPRGCCGAHRISRASPRSR